MDQLRQHLRDNGYTRFSDEPHCVNVSEWQIEQTTTGWQIGFFEQGRLTTIVLETPDEAVAVQHFLQTVSKEIHHVKTFKHVDGIEKLEAALNHADVPFRRNDIPHEGLMRIFVLGTYLRRALAIAAKEV